MKISLGAQIEEVQHELKMRRDVYTRQVANGKMRQSVADMHLARMGAVQDTLEWVQAHSAVIR